VKKKDIESYLEEAISNIRDDRAIASDLLIDLMGFLKGSADGHRQSGPVAAKYLETLQRSNEQLVKLTTLMEKQSTANPGLTEDDKNQIFDMLNEDN
jgi:hypothetical protein